MKKKGLQMLSAFLSSDKRGWAFLFAAALFYCYLITFSGAIVSGDNIAQYFQTKQILEKHTFSFSQQEVKELSSNDSWIAGRFSPNTDGVTFSQWYGIGQPLMTIPIFTVLRFIKSLLHLAKPEDVTLWCMNWLFYTWLCVILIIGFLEKSIPDYWKALFVLTVAFASPLWMYGNGIYNVMGETLITASCIYLCLLISGIQKDGIKTIGTLCGILSILLVWGLFTRPFFVTSLPAFIFYCHFVLFRETAKGSRRMIVPPVLIFWTALILGAALFAYYNWSHFGSAFKTAYSRSIYGDLVGFNGSWRAGIMETVFKPSKCPLYFFPALIFFPAAIILLMKHKDYSWVFIVLFMAPQIYLIPKIRLFSGGDGPCLFMRYWVRVIPVVFFSIAQSIPYFANKKFINLFIILLFTVCFIFGFKASIFTAMTDDRAVYHRLEEASVLQDPPIHTLSVKQIIKKSILDYKLIASIQKRQWSAPRDFLIIRDLSKPGQRIFLLIPGIALSVMALVKLLRLTAEEP